MAGIYSDSFDSAVNSGVNYELSMHVSLADNFQYGSDAIAAFFSSYPIIRYDNFRFTETPQAINPPGNFVTDQTEWTMISFSFVADSAYTYVTIGNFNDDAHTPFIAAGEGQYQRSYFYIDDISLNGGSVGYNITGKNSSNPYPNPFTSVLSVPANANEISEFILFDLAGKELIRQKITGTPASISTDELKSGMYLYKRTNANGSIQSGKIVKQ